MKLRTTAVATGLAVLLGAGTALAQSGPAYPPPQQDMPYGHHHGHGHHHGVMELIREEVQAGRISRKEGARLQDKIKMMHAERRAERGEHRQGAFEPDGVRANPPPPQQPPNPR